MQKIWQRVLRGGAGDYKSVHAVLHSLARYTRCCSTAPKCGHSAAAGSVGSFVKAIAAISSPLLVTFIFLRLYDPQ